MKEKIIVHGEEALEFLRERGIEQDVLKNSYKPRPIPENILQDRELPISYRENVDLIWADCLINEYKFRLSTIGVDPKTAVIGFLVDYEDYSE